MSGSPLIPSRMVLETARIPNAWYTIAATSELSAGQILPFTLAGFKLIAYRTESGQLNVIEQHCPHMGANLANAAVSGEQLRCPMHHFEFSTDGACQQTPFAETHSNARTQPWPSLERNGLIMVYFHAQGQPPDWQPKAITADDYGPMTMLSTNIKASVQTVMEGIADKAHLTTVHGYSDIDMHSFSTDNELLTARYSFTNNGALPGAGSLQNFLATHFSKPVRVVFDYWSYGLGYSLTEVEVPAMGIRMRHFVNPTPINDTELKLFHSIAIAPINARKISPLLALLPASWVQALMTKVLLRSFKHDIADDIFQWQNLQALSSPSLCKADGPINKFRRWAEAFYC